MKHQYKIIITIIAALVAGAIATLWAWNTLADLFAWPAAEFRHVLAAFLLLSVLRFGIRGRDTRHGPARYPIKAARNHGS